MDPPEPLDELLLVAPLLELLEPPEPLEDDELLDAPPALVVPVDAPPPPDPKSRVVAVHAPNVTRQRPDETSTGATITARVLDMTTLRRRPQH